MGPLMMMSGGMGGAGAQGGMNPMLMLALMDDSSSCTIKNAAVNALTATADEKKAIANGSKCHSGTAVVACTTSNRNKEHIDYDFIKCESGSSGMSDLLPLMMMGGGMGGGAAGGMGSMLPLLMMDDSSSSSDLLPLMMMSGGMGGGAGGMDPMMMMLMLDDEKTGKEGCDSKHKISKIVLTSGAEETNALKIRAAVEGNTILAPTVASSWITAYKACLASPPTSSSSSSSMKDLLPLMMMSGGMGGAAGGQAGAMDPMMMMALM